MQDRLLNEKEAAEYLGVSVGYLRLSRMNGYVGSGDDDPPPWIKFGRHVRYRRQDLDAWIQAHVVTSSHNRL